MHPAPVPEIPTSCLANNGDEEAADPAITEMFTLGAANTPPKPALDETAMPREFVP